jgi:hypothetical protein
MIIKPNAKIYTYLMTFPKWTLLQSDIRLDSTCEQKESPAMARTASWRGSNKFQPSEVVGCGHMPITLVLLAKNGAVIRSIVITPNSRNGSDAR